MSKTKPSFVVISLLLFAVLAFAPLVGNQYTLAVMISLLMYANLATVWGIFAGTARLISLATAAFFGVGCYTVAVWSEILPWPLVLVLAAVFGGLLALVIGLCTLRLSGMYFVIFTFGVAEMIRQIATWYEATIEGAIGRYIFMDFTSAQIYWQLLGLLAVVWVLGAWLVRSRLGFALRLMGDDSTAARSVGINTVYVRLLVFVITSMFMSVVGAIVAPRWTYIDASIAFDSLISFQVVIMALLGGMAAFWGPVLGVIPLVIAFELLTKYFPDHFSLVLGAIFLCVVYWMPGGLLGLTKRRGGSHG